MTKVKKLEGMDLKRSDFYQRMIQENKELLRHKWLESEKKGKDVGFDRALIDWIIKRSTGWRNIKID